MSSNWPAHTQVLGKLAVVLAPPEPQLQHTALRLTARGWETLPLPAPDGSGALVAALDLHSHEAVVEHSDGRVRRVALAPDRPVGEVTREVLAAVHALVGAVEIDPTPQETEWTTPLDEDTEITGPVAAGLYISSSTTDTDLFVTLRAFAPDGSEVDFQGALDPHTPLAQGWLRASHRRLDASLSAPYRPYHTHDTAEPLTPGEVYALQVELWPTCIVLPAGYRLALTLQGKDFERATAAVQPASFVNPFRGSGPFTHTNRQDRPATIASTRFVSMSIPVTSNPASLSVSARGKPT